MSLGPNDYRAAKEFLSQFVEQVQHDNQGCIAMTPLTDPVGKGIVVLGSGMVIVGTVASFAPHRGAKLAGRTIAALGAIYAAAGTTLIIVGEAHDVILGCN